MKERGQISEDQMYWEKQDVIEKGLAGHFFVEGAVTSPLLMEILYNGYKSITTNNTMAQFIRIKENRFELVDDVPSLFKRVVGIGYKPIKALTPHIEDYERILTKLGCMIVELYVVDYLFRNIIEVNFTRSDLIQTEKKSKKKGKKKAKPKKNDKCVEENKQKADLINKSPRKVQVGFPLLYVCMVALICVVLATVFTLDISGINHRGRY